MATLHVSIAPEEIFSIAGFHVTNSTFTTVLVTIMIFILARYIGSRISVKPTSNVIVTLGELVVVMWQQLCQSIAGKNAKEYFPLITTMFIFVILSNWIGLLPGFGTIGLNKPALKNDTHAITTGVIHAAESESPAHTTTFVPLFRAPTADLNATLALALISVIYIQYTGFKHLGTHYSKKFINLSSPINAFVGVLEIISEISRVISFTFRLFGNVFAGEVLLAVIAFLIPVIASLPFIGLEIFVGFIQAFVFAILTLIFLSQAVMSHDH